MTLNRVLALTSVALGALLVIQMAFGSRPILRVSGDKPPVRQFHASWVNNANTLTDGKAQSDHVILGEVIELRKGPDIVVPAPGEPGGQDQVSTTIVKFTVHKTYKGAPGAVVELLQTGQATDALLVPTPTDLETGENEEDKDKKDEDKNDKDGNHGHGKAKGKGSRPAGQSTTSPSKPSAGESTRATILEDDPPYQIGEKYVLFLKNMQHPSGTPAALAAVGPGMTRALAPEGRYQVTKGDHLKPATNRKGFAPNWKGRPLSDFEAEVTKP